MIIIRHVYREINPVTDWIIIYVIKHSGNFFMDVFILDLYSMNAPSYPKKNKIKRRIQTYSLFALKHYLYILDFELHHIPVMHTNDKVNMSSAF